MATSRAYRDSPRSRIDLDLVDTEEVTGSIPVSPTSYISRPSARYRSPGNGRLFFWSLRWEHFGSIGCSPGVTTSVFRFPSEHFLVPKVLTAQRGAVLLPARLQALDESLFDGGADVAVDAPDAGESVTEPFGLGDLGDAVLDEPGLVAVSEIVEVQPADDRGDAVVRVAVDGGMPAPAVEAGAAVQPTVATVNTCATTRVCVGVEQLAVPVRTAMVATLDNGE
jgi:hypothetical protein